MILVDKQTVVGNKPERKKTPASTRFEPMPPGYLLSTTTDWAIKSHIRNEGTLEGFFSRFSFTQVNNDIEW